MKEPTAQELLDELDRVCLLEPIPDKPELHMDDCKDAYLDEYWYENWTQEELAEMSREIKKQIRIVAYLRDRSWKELTLKSLLEEYQGVPANLPSCIDGYGYSYYIGAFLRIMVKEGNTPECGTFTFGVLWSIIRNGEKLSFRKARVARDIFRFHKKRIHPEMCSDMALIDLASQVVDNIVRIREDAGAPDYAIFS